MRLKTLSCAVAAGVLALASVPASAVVVLAGVAKPGSSGFADISYDIAFNNPELYMLAGTTQRIAVSIFSGVIDSASAFTDDRLQFDQISSFFDGTQNHFVNDGNDEHGFSVCSYAGGAASCDVSQSHIPVSFNVSGSKAVLEYSLPANDARCATDAVGCVAFYDWFAAGGLNLSVKSTNPVAYRVSVNSFASAVPEPASWAMMIAGFGMIGALTRKQRRMAGRVLA